MVSSTEYRDSICLMFSIIKIGVLGGISKVDAWGVLENLKTRVCNGFQTVQE